LRTSNDAAVSMVVLVIWSAPAEIDEARLVGMKREPVLLPLLALTCRRAAMQHSGRSRGAAVSCPREGVLSFWSEARRNLDVARPRFDSVRLLQMPPGVQLATSLNGGSIALMEVVELAVTGRLKILVDRYPPSAAKQA
jgi:hypothetical protein